MKSVLDGQEIYIEKDFIGIRIREPFHSAWITYGWKEGASFGLNIKLINLAQNLDKPILIRCGLSKYLGDVWQVANWIAEHNSFKKTGKTTLGIVGVEILKAVL